MYWDHMRNDLVKRVADNQLWRMVSCSCWAWGLGFLFGGFVAAVVFQVQF